MSASSIAGPDHASAASVSLLDVEPHFGWPLTPDERQAAATINLPVRTINPDDDLLAECRQLGAFGAILLEGLLVHEVRMGEHNGIRLLGPGDAVIAESGSDPVIVGVVRWASAGKVRAAFLGPRLLVALNRWPLLMVGLYRQMGQQVERLATQLVICQLPRVEDRILALMWLLAGTWGRVTVSGTRLPLELTHEALGKMIGARRPTVTLAVRALADRGAMLRQSDGWLLLEAPPGDRLVPLPQGARTPLPSVLRTGDRTFSESADQQSHVVAAHATSSYSAVLETVHHLREQHESNLERFDKRLQELRSTRQRCAATRDRVAGQRVSRRPLPPS